MQKEAADPTCPMCGYSLVGIENAICPECGVDTESLPVLTLAQAELKRRIDRWNKIGIAIWIGSAAAQIIVPLVFGTRLEMAFHIVPVVVVGVAMFFFLAHAFDLKRELKPFHSSLCVFTVIFASIYYWLPVSIAIVYMRVNFLQALLFVHLVGVPVCWVFLVFTFSFSMKKLAEERLVENGESWWFFSIFTICSLGAMVFSLVGVMFGGGYLPSP